MDLVNSMHSNILYILTIPENCDYERNFFRICKEVADRTNAHFFVESDADNWAWDPAPKKVVYVHLTGSITVDILQKALCRPEQMESIYKMFLIIPESLFQFPDIRRFYHRLINYFTPIYLNSQVEALQRDMKSGVDDLTIYRSYAEDIVDNELSNPPDCMDPLVKWEQQHTNIGYSTQIKQLKLMVDSLRACVELLGSQVDMLEKQLN